VVPIVALFIGIFGYSSVAMADVSQSDFSYPSISPQSTYMQGLGDNLTGSATSFTFYTSNPSSWVSDYTGGSEYVTISSCTTNWNGDEQTCTGTRVRNPERSSDGASISVSGNYVTIIFSSPISLNPSLWYTFAWYRGSGMDTLYGSLTETYLGSGGTQCSFVCNFPPYELYFNLAGATGGNWGGSPSNTGTRIISVSPQNASIVATTTSMGGATTTEVKGYVTDTDIASSTQVSVSYSNQGCASLSITALQAVNGDCSLSITYQITSSGNFDFSTTTLFNYIGQWNYVATIENTTGSYCIFGYCLINNSTDLSQVSGSFKIGTTTAYDRLVQQIASTSQAVPPDLTGCNPFSGQFDLGGCTAALFLPSASDTQEFITSYTGQFLQYWPLGYVTRFVVILSSSTPQALPSISYTDTSGNPLLSSIGTIAFDPLGDLVSSSSLFNTAVSNVSANPETIWQILGPLAQIIIYLTLIGMMLHDITGIFKHHR